MRKIFIKYHFELIIIVLIILTHFIQLTNKASKNIKNSDLEYSVQVGVIAWDIIPKCHFWLNNLRLSLPDCTTWSSSGNLSIIGKLTQSSAADNISQKVLIKKVMYSFAGNEDSLKNRLVDFVNNSSLQFNKRRAVIFSYLEEKDRSILLALLFGQSSSGLTPQVYQYFTQAGLVNLISVSSYCFHLTIEALLFLTKKFSARRRVFELLTVIVISSIVLLVGYPLALQRVVYALCIHLLSKRIFHRPISSFYRLLLSSLLLLAVNPYAIFDIGLEFSVLASLGIQLFPQPPQFLYNLCNTLLAKWGRRVSQLLWLSVTAQIFTWPLIFYYFGEMSLMSPISNIAVLWILPSILALGVVYWLTGQFYLPILPALTPILVALLSLFKVELRFLASFGYVVKFQARQQHLALGYCLISFFIFVIFFKHKRYLSQSISHNLQS